jgi:hypothetical protein
MTVSTSKMDRFLPVISDHDLSSEYVNVSPPPTSQNQLHKYEIDSGSLGNFKSSSGFTPLCFATCKSVSRFVFLLPAT